MVEVIAGRYRLGGAIGAGGMAHVVEGHDDRLDRRVAIKLIATDSIDPVARERFRREARTSARFAHPNAVAIYDAGEADGHLFLVMELVDGRSLAHRLAVEGPLDVYESVRISDAVLAALQAAHAAGIVHRDVKPGNILLGRNGDVKLADFGIAKRLDDLSCDLTGTGHFVGTPKYLAPEQLTGEPATPATDLYATGVVLYEMLTGGAPFDGGTPLATAVAHRTAPAPDVREARPDVPPHLATTVSTALAKDPADRFQSAAAMRAALVGAAVARPLSAHRRPVAAIASGPRARWWVVPAVLLLAVGAAAFVLGRRDDAPVSSVTSSPPTAPATAPPPATAVATSPATTVPATNPPTTAAPPAPQTLADLIALLAADPQAFGQRAEDLHRALERIVDDRGNDSGRASRVLEDARDWVNDGELSPTALALLDQLVGPLAASDDEGEDDG